MPVTVEQSRQWLLNNCGSDCLTTVRVTVQHSCQSWRIMPIVPVAVAELRQWLLNNRARERQRERGTYSKVKSKSGVKWILNILFVIFFKMQKKHRNCFIQNYQSCLCYFLSKKKELIWDQVFIRGNKASSYEMYRILCRSANSRMKN